MNWRVPLLGVAAATLLTVAFWFLLFAPAGEERAALAEETAGLVAQQQSLRNEITRLEDIRSREPELRADLDRLALAVPGEVAQPTLVELLQASADAAGVEIDSVTFGVPEPVVGAPAADEPGKGLARVPLTLMVDGGYFQAVDLLRRLEDESPRAVLVSNVAIAEGEDGFPDLTTTMTGHVFAVLPAPAATATPAPAAGTAPAPTPPAAPTTETVSQ